MSALPIEIDPLAGLPAHLHDEMTDILRKIAAADLPLERNPNAPSLVATKIEGRLFQIGVVHAGGLPTRVAVFGPGPTQNGVYTPGETGLTEWDRETFLALVPTPAELAAAPAPTLRPINLKRDPSEILEDVLLELRAIRNLLIGGPVQ